MTGTWYHVFSSKVIGRGSDGVDFSFVKDAIVFRFAEDSTPEEVETAFKDAFRSPDCPRKADILIDTLSSRRHRPLFEVSRLGEALAAFSTRMGSRCALVMREDRPRPEDLDARLSAIALRHKIRFGVFFDLESAMEWLST